MEIKTFALVNFTNEDPEVIGIYTSLENAWKDAEEMGFESYKIVMTKIPVEFS